MAMRKEITNKKNSGEKGTAASYLIGFAISIALTIAAYIATEIHVNSSHEAISHPVLTTLLLGFAFLQLITQAVFFLRLGAEVGPRWKLGSFVAALGLVLIVVAASIWIMGHLNYNMTPAQINQYMQAQQGGF